nr:hypothetical protein [Sphingomonas psychrotolerans]
MLALILASISAHTPPLVAGRQVERLDRGLIAIPAAGGGNHVSWRLLATDVRGARFTLYRDGKAIARIAGDQATSYLDPTGTATSRYALAAHNSGATAWTNGYLPIPLDKPADGRTPDGETYGYTANDASVGDLDGDGRYELIVKWYPTIAKDNAFPAIPAAPCSTPIRSMAGSCGGSISAPTSARGRTIPSSWSTISTATAGPRSR